MEHPGAPDQVYVSGWPKRVVTSRLVPRPALLAIARAAVGIMRRRIRARDRAEAATLPGAPVDGNPRLYFADIYHGGATFWDWVVLRGGGLWWDVLWPLVITTSVERLRAHAELRTVLELDAHTYEELETHRPGDIVALRAVIAAGKMEIVNGTYAQPLAPTIGGEANLRHFSYGLTAIERVLGARVHSFVAGEPQFFPQLPQVLAGFGIRNAVFRTHWAPFGTDPAANADVVCWQGPDGSQVRAVPRYECMDYRLLADGHPGVQNAGLSGDDFEQWQAERKGEFAAQAAELGIRRPFVTRLADPKPPESPFPHVLAAARDPRCRMVTVSEYCDARHSSEPLVSYTIDDIPSTIPWGMAGEQLHRDQALAESALLLAERLDAIGQTLGFEGRQDALDAAWKLLLRSQHHDLHLCLPWHSTRHNVSMGEVGCRFARRSSEQAQAVAAAAIEALAAHFRPAATSGRAFLLFNPSAWPRREFVELPAAAGAIEMWQRGTRLAAQAAGGGDPERPTVGFVIDLPPLGVDVVEVRAGASDAPRPQAAVEMPAATDVIAREMAAGAIQGGYLSVWWDGRLHRSVVERVRRDEDGPVFRRYRLDGHVAKLAFTQWITAVPSVSRIDLVTEIDFGGGRHFGPQMADHSAEVAYYIQDERKLCLSFESALPRLFCDSPFLLVEPRGPRVTGLSFLGLEAPGGTGVAVLHRGTPGWHIDRTAGVARNVLAWAPERWLYASDDSITPGWSRYTAVRGTQRYEHALVPVSTRLGAIRFAHDFRLPVLAVDLPGGKGNASLPWSFLEAGSEQIILTALFARDGNTYARLWNAGNDATEVTLRGARCNAVPVSLRLEQETQTSWPSARPWGIQTVRLSAR